MASASSLKISGQQESFISWACRARHVAYRFFSLTWAAPAGHRFQSRKALPAMEAMWRSARSPPAETSSRNSRAKGAFNLSRPVLEDISNMAAPDTKDIGSEGRITVSGHQIDVGDALRAHVVEQASRLSKKYFDGAEEIIVTFSPGGGKKAAFGCNVRVHAGRNLFFDGSGEHSKNAYTAFSTALERVDKQLRRQKRAMREDKPVNAMKEALL